MFKYKKKNSYTLITKSYKENFLNRFYFSGSIDLHIIGHTNAIDLWRRMLGPTKVYHAQFKEPYCLRGMFGISDTRNVAHGSGMLDFYNRIINISNL